MPYEIDQSNKIESGGDTIIAASNGLQFSIRIPFKEKRIALDYLRHRSGGTRKLSQLRLFAVALYYLFETIPTYETVIIDTEYEGHEPEILSLLLNLLWRENSQYDGDCISFGRVGKKSNAHKVALDVYRKARKADRTLKADDLLRKIIGP